MLPEFFFSLPKKNDNRTNSIGFNYNILLQSRSKDHPLLIFVILFQKNQETILSLKIMFFLINLLGSKYNLGICDL